MPNLMPDTSFYPRPQNNSMSLGELLSVAQGARAYERQTAVDQALRANTDQSTGTIDATKTISSLIANAPPGTLTPDTLGSIVQNQQIGVNAVNANNAAVANALQGVITKPGATRADAAPLMAMVSGVPPDQRMKMLDAISNPDGTIDKQKGATLIQSLTGNQGIPTTDVTLGSGAVVQQPAAVVARPLITGESGEGGAAPGTGGYGPGGITKSLPGGAGESITAAVAAQHDMSAFQTGRFAYEQALDKMEAMQARGETFGPGSEGRNTAESFLYTLAPSIAKYAGINPDKIADYSSAAKYLSQGLIGQFGGSRLADQYASAVSGTPNVHITDLAAVPLTKAMLGVTTMQYVQNWLGMQAGKANFLDESSRVSPKMDPRAMAAKYMSAADINKLQGSLKGVDRQRFNANLAAGILSGAIPNKWNFTRPELTATMSNWFNR